MICEVKLWYIILINGDMHDRGLHRRKAINSKSGKKRLILSSVTPVVRKFETAHLIPTRHLAGIVLRLQRLSQTVPVWRRPR